MNHLSHLRTVAMEDVSEIERKEATYQGSWRRGGGVNAWHMARRKIDRLMVMLAPPSASDVQNLKDFVDNVHRAGDSVRDEVDGEHNLWYVRFHTHPKMMAKVLMRFASGEDIFQAMDADQSGADGTVLAEVRDLRRYLLLFEARLLAERPMVLSHVSVQEKGDTEHTVITNNSAAVYDREVSAEDSNKHAERLVPRAVGCSACGDTKIITQNTRDGSITFVCPVCRT